MKILVTNDDGFEAKGISELVEILRPYGDLTVVAPKKPQSGMSMAVSMGLSMGLRPIAVRKLSEKPGERWWYLDGTPASCIKYGIDNIFWPDRPDLVVSGINHGSNAATAALYSGTLGAAMEGAVNGIPSVGVSLDAFDHDADFSAVASLLPGILDELLKSTSPIFLQTESRASRSATWAGRTGRGNTAPSANSWYRSAASRARRTWSTCGPQNRGRRYA